MSRYKDALNRNAEVYKKYGWDELPDTEPYLEIGLAYIRENLREFIEWIMINTKKEEYIFLLEEIMQEALNSLDKRFDRQSKIINSELDQFIIDYVVKNTSIETDYELTRESILYDERMEQEQPIDENWHSCLYDRG